MMSNTDRANDVSYNIHLAKASEMLRRSQPDLATLVDRAEDMIANGTYVPVEHKTVLAICTSQSAPLGHWRLSIGPKESEWQIHCDCPAYHFQPVQFEGRNGIMPMCKHVVAYHLHNRTLRLEEQWNAEYRAKEAAARARQELA